MLIASYQSQLEATEAAFVSSALSAVQQMPLNLWSARLRTFIDAYEIEPLEFFAKVFTLHVDLDGFMDSFFIQLFMSLQIDSVLCCAPQSSCLHVTNVISSFELGLEGFGMALALCLLNPDAHIPLDVVLSPLIILALFWTR